MAGLLPPGLRCSAWWYARARGLPQDLDCLMQLGAVAAGMARWEGLEPWQVPERHPDGITYLVHMWPERIWDAAANGVQAAARAGSPRVLRDPYCDRCNYDMHACPGCGLPLAHGVPCCEGCARP